MLRYLAHACTAVKERAPRDTFFRNHEPSRVPEISLSYSQSISMYSLSGK